MIPFKAVAIDMDGTFLRDDKSYDKKLFSELLNKMKEKDIHFIVASGNQFERTRLDFTEYWKDMSFVAENGMYLLIVSSNLLMMYFSNLQLMFLKKKLYQRLMKLTKNLQKEFLLLQVVLEILI